MYTFTIYIKRNNKTRVPYTNWHLCHTSLCFFCFTSDFHSHI